MHSDDHEQFSILMAILSETYNRDISTMLMEIYFRVLSPYTIHEIDSAVYKAISECVFFPKPAELVNRIHAARIRQWMIEGQQAEQKKAEKRQLAAEYWSRN
jgi:hypothetical protein